MHSPYKEDGQAQYQDFQTKEDQDRKGHRSRVFGYTSMCDREVQQLPRRVGIFFLCLAKKFPVNVFVEQHRALGIGGSWFPFKVSPRVRLREL